MSKIYFNDHIITNSTFLDYIISFQEQTVSSKSKPWDNVIFDHVRKNSLIVKRKFDVDSTGIINEFIRFGKCI